ncbi:hypothetical protein D9M68_841350 [compost metagenome]
MQQDPARTIDIHLASANADAGAVRCHQAQALARVQNDVAIGCGHHYVLSGIRFDVGFLRLQKQIALVRNAAQLTAVCEEPDSLPRIDNELLPCGHLLVQP